MRNPKAISRKARKQGNLPRLVVIYNLQDGHCYLCGGKMPYPAKKRPPDPKQAASLDHVVPKNPWDRDRACRQIRRNSLVAHHGCNNRKHNRMPYPCEILHLELVNEKLAEIEIRAKFAYEEKRQRREAYRVTQGLAYGGL
jgi:5-methylcytosine-specific restriction endonuclease McrA